MRMAWGWGSDSEKSLGRDSCCHNIIGTGYLCITFLATMQQQCSNLQLFHPWHQTFESRGSAWLLFLLLLSVRNTPWKDPLDQISLKGTWGKWERLWEGNGCWQPEYREIEHCLAVVCRECLPKWSFCLFFRSTWSPPVTQLYTTCNMWLENLQWHKSKSH